MNFIEDSAFMKWNNEKIATDCLINKKTWYYEISVP